MQHEAKPTVLPDGAYTIDGADLLRAKMLELPMLRTKQSQHAKRPNRSERPADIAARIAVPLSR
jgi:hypothetical protein